LCFGLFEKSQAPSKVVAFYWKLLFDCIPIKINLVQRNVLPLDATLNFVLCGGGEESTS
jgi:hypothetical protein